MPATCSTTKPITPIQRNILAPSTSRFSLSTRRHPYYTDEELYYIQLIGDKMVREKEMLGTPISETSFMNCLLELELEFCDIFPNRAPYNVFKKGLGLFY